MFLVILIIKSSICFDLNPRRKLTLFVERGPFIVRVEKSNHQIGAGRRDFLVVQLAVFVGDLDRLQLDHQRGLVVLVVQEARLAIQLVCNFQFAIVLVQREQIARIFVEKVGQFAAEIHELQVDALLVQANQLLVVQCVSIDCPAQGDEWVS